MLNTFTKTVGQKAYMHSISSSEVPLALDLDRLVHGPKAVFASVRTPTQHECSEPMFDMCNGGVHQL